jgi:hypothetical protein
MIEAKGPRRSTDTGPLHVSTRFAWTDIGNILVGVHSEDGPDDRDWNEYLEAGRRIVATNGSVRVLAYSLGGSPNSLQRSKVNELFKDVPSRTAVMLDSRIARGAVTALSWFIKGIHAFGLDQLDDACGYLELSTKDAAEVRRAVGALRDQMLATRAAGARGG